MTAIDSYERLTFARIGVAKIKHAMHLRSDGGLLYAAMLAFIVLAPLIRELGGLLYAYIVAVCVIAVVWRRAWFANLPFSIFMGIGVLYVAASYAGAFPQSWTRLYDLGSIPQQAAFVFTLYFLIGAGRLFWFDVLSSPTAKGRLWLLVGAGFLGPALLGIALGQFDVATAFGEFFRSLSNAAMMGYLALALLVFVGPPRRRILLALILTPFMVVLTPFLQNSLTALAFLGLAITPWPRAATAVAIIVFLLIWFVSFNFLNEITLAVPTLGVRLRLQLDAFEAIRQTLGLGVGFGTEAIRPRSFLNPESYLAGINPNETITGWIQIGVHNSFVGMFFRLGLVGGLAFLWFFIVDLFPRRYHDLGLTRLWCFAYFTLFLVVFSNPAIESAAYHVGVGFAIGLLLALRKLAALPFRPAGVSRK